MYNVLLEKDGCIYKKRMRQMYNVLLKKGWMHKKMLRKCTMYC